jgi:hypothetical protein
MRGQSQGTKTGCPTRRKGAVRIALTGRGGSLISRVNSGVGPGTRNRRHVPCRQAHLGSVAVTLSDAHPAISGEDS